MSRTRLAISVALAGFIIGSLASLPSPAVATVKSSPQVVVKEVVKDPIVTTKEVEPAVIMSSVGGYSVIATRFPSPLSTLSGISMAVYGTARNWVGLCNANKIANCDAIQAGQKIFAPTTNNLNNTLPTRPSSERASRSNTTTTTQARGWVHPLASGKLGLSCWGAARGGRSHQGVDISQPTGTPIRSVHAGKVVLSRWTGGGGYTVAVDHGNGIQSIYMHMVRPGLPVGRTVSAGTTIGHVGSTGNSTGPHLHFEIHKGLWNRINPAPFMRSVGVNIGC